jgi:hypothetical protein
LANNPNPIKKGCKDILYWRYFHGKDLSWFSQILWWPTCSATIEIIN